MLMSAGATLIERLSEATTVDHPFSDEPGLTIDQHEAVAKLLVNLSEAASVLAVDRRGSARLAGLLDAAARTSGTDRRVPAAT
ncbi:hypothetical protein ACLQ25_18550 [Micromonospora sp. DT44]|uniref:hypothetical protein n=1 Tax=Micromonospora sp. DT44 TaxID=3393439 RepID=UPI003CED7DB6